MNTATECKACANLKRVGVPVQCNRCRREAPNRTTLVRRELTRIVVTEGVTAVEAEARVGVTAGPTLGG